MTSLASEYCGASTNKSVSVSIFSLLFSSAVGLFGWELDEVGDDECEDDLLKIKTNVTNKILDIQKPCTSVGALIQLNSPICLF
jgi:hypothetical protein